MIRACVCSPPFEVRSHPRGLNLNRAHRSRAYVRQPISVPSTTTLLVDGDNGACYLPASAHFLNDLPRAAVPRLPARYDWKTVVFTLRERRNQTQVEFAASLDCSVFTVSKWECGETVPAAKHRRLLEAMGVEVGHLASDWPEASFQQSLFEHAPR